MTTPLHDEEHDDATLCALAVGGDHEALERLVRRHQRFVFNLALRLVLSPVDAEDLAQEALVRVVTRLHQFRGDSAFRTWMYRIVMRCFLDGKRRSMEHAIVSFDDYGRELDAVPMTHGPHGPELGYLVQEARIGCMTGMLLCLDRAQRAAYVLGEIFEVPGAMAAEILELSHATYRKRLERARRDMVAFMNEKCGLLDPSNPCRCARKTRGFIDEGWVRTDRRVFTTEHVERARALAPELCETLDAHAAALFREHPMLDGPDIGTRLESILELE